MVEAFIRIANDLYCKEKKLPPVIHYIYLRLGRESELPMDFSSNLISEDKTEDVEQGLKGHLDRWHDALVRAELQLKRHSDESRE